MADGKWQMADGRWQMADGRWQMADDRYILWRTYFLFRFGIECILLKDQLFSMA